MAERFVRVASDRDVIEAVDLADKQGLELTIIGGGSNLVLTRDVPGLVMFIASKGVQVLGDDGETAIVEAAAGEGWDPFVQRTLALGLRGLENLSLIPGTVGASPIQNIGAYGVELKDVLVGVSAYDRHQRVVRELTLADCGFGYRDSRFKREPGRWIVLRVRVSLSRSAPLNLAYGAVRERLACAKGDEPSALDVARAVCAIRREKLPDPAIVGNAGSFFKNPVVDGIQAQALAARWPDLVRYEQPDGRVKLAAGWLIDRAGWKGYRDGDAGVHRAQALVLVNHGQASGADILALARLIQRDIAARFGVALEIEPRVL